ncbi:hypothetical protein E8E11_002418 [Didymella keratinophila]|nr:hypothetical protein E8E11_002418 [Didymella keratinophila]
MGETETWKRESLKAWATSSLANDFTRFETYIKTKQLDFSPVVFIKDESGNGFPVEPGKKLAIRVGTQDGNATTVYAWRISGGIDIGFERKNPSPGSKPAEDEASFARFEAIVRYIFLTVCRYMYLVGNISLFKEHFPSACRDTAQEVVRETSRLDRPCRLELNLPQNPVNVTAQRATSTPQLSVTPQPADTSPRPVAPTGPTLASDEHLQNLDQAVSIFRATLLSQTGTAQAASRQEIAGLNVKIEDLETRLGEAVERQEQADAERAVLIDKISRANRRMLEVEADVKTSKSEAAAAKERARKAEEEAEKIKV